MFRFERRDFPDLSMTPALFLGGPESSEPVDDEPDVADQRQQQPDVFDEGGTVVQSQHHAGLRRQAEQVEQVAAAELWSAGKTLFNGFTIGHRT